MGETGTSIAQTARDLGINDGTLANGVKKDRLARGEAAAAGGVSEDERTELTRSRPENAELALGRAVLTRSVVLREHDVPHAAACRALGASVFWFDK
ncbi:hypothetical protein [Micromonospora sp. MW-13]|uniref:hypothetical protein n=1 Tax=Micromonospora sp. MW-13 TaxID=2094022 RepID=UPI001A9E3601|nr:hypothetical protein [Micromonospora sp. MW-13]